MSKLRCKALNPFPLDTQSESNRADIRDYLRHELATQLQNRPDADRLVEQILEKSEGVFLYVERFCDDVQHGHLSLDRPEQFPQGLGGIFCQYFQRQFPDLEKFRKDVRPALRAILAAREPLPVEILQRLFNWQDEELRDFTRPLASLFPVTNEAGHEVIKPYHKSLADWLADEAKAGAYFVSVMEGHRMLCDLGWELYRGASLTLFSYLVRNIPTHLYESRSFERLYLIFRDTAYTTALGHGDILALSMSVRLWCPIRSIGETVLVGNPGGHWIIEKDSDGPYHWCMGCGYCDYSGDWHAVWRGNPSAPCPECGYAGNLEEKLAFDQLETKFAKPLPDVLNAMSKGK